MITRCEPLDMSRPDTDTFHAVEWFEDDVAQCAVYCDELNADNHAASLGQDKCVVLRYDVIADIGTDVESAQAFVRENMRLG